MVGGPTPSHSLTTVHSDWGYMPIINKQWSVTLPSAGVLDGGNPAQIAFDTQIDLARELSEYYGKNIRQGQTFFVAGAQVGMRAANGEYDVGLSSLTKIRYCPSTKHTRQAWMDAFKLWAKQKRLRAGAIGQRNPYDDLEFAYSNVYDTSTTSTLFQGGLADSDADKMVLYGSSNETDNIFSLEDYYTSTNQPQPPSRYSHSNEVIKEAKFNNFWPEPRSFDIASNASAMHGQIAIEVPLLDDLTGMGLGGSNMTADIQTLPELAPALCGVLQVSGWVIPDDTTLQLQDNAILYLTIWVKKFKPIFPERKSSKKSSKKSSGSRRTSRRSSR